MPQRHPALIALGSNVRRIREAKGLTQERLGEHAELDPTYISGIERGVRNPSLVSIVRVAQALKITVSALCEGVER